MMKVLLLTSVHPVPGPLPRILLLGAGAPDHTGEPPAQPVFRLHVGGRGDGLELLVHGVAAVGSLDGVGGGVCYVGATVLVGQHLHLFVQQVLAQLVGLRHLRPAQAFPARLLARHTLAVLPHVGDVAPHSVNTRPKLTPIRN